MSPDSSRSAAVLDALAWGVQRGLHLPDVLRSLPMYTERMGRAPRILSGLKPVIRLLYWPTDPLWLVPIILFAGLASFLTGGGEFVARAAPFPLLLLPLLIPIARLRWSWNLSNLCADLEAGEPLSQALETNFRRHYPGYIFSALRLAEEQGMVETALPRLAEKVRYQRELGETRSLPINYTVLKLLITSYAILFLAIFILPKFQEVYNDVLGEGTVLPWTTQFIMSGQLKLAGLLVLLALPLTLLTWVRIPVIGPYVAQVVPFIRRDLQRQELCEASGSMVSFLEQGLSLEDAAEWSSRSSSFARISIPLKQFAEQLRSGTPWHEAWKTVGLGTPSDTWVLTHAVMQETPGPAFQELHDWAKVDIDRASRLICNWLDPVVSIVIGLITGLLTLGLYLPLIEMVDSLTSAY